MTLNYVFTQEQVQPLNIYLDSVRNQYPNYTIIIPCAIKNDLYTLPYPIFDEEAFVNIRDGAQPYLVGVEVREIEPDEFLEIPPFNPQTIPL